MPGRRRCPRWRLPMLRVLSLVGIRVVLMETRRPRPFTQGVDLCLQLHAWGIRRAQIGEQRWQGFVRCAFGRKQDVQKGFIRV